MNGIGLIKKIAALPFRQRARTARGADAPPLGQVRFGDLRRLTPIARDWGNGRGSPIDRYYIDRFLATYAGDIRGRTLDIEENAYTRQYGGDRVTQSDVLHIQEGNPDATIVADLTTATEAQIPSDAFDCMILTQTLQLIYDAPAALRTIHRILKPGGVLLASFPGISQVSRHSGVTQPGHEKLSDADDWGQYWCWNFTSMSARRMFGEFFPDELLTVQTWGNVLAAVALLQGITIQELTVEELEAHDPEYELLITVRAQKALR